MGEYEKAVQKYSNSVVQICNWDSKKSRIFNMCRCIPFSRNFIDIQLYLLFQCI